MSKETAEEQKAKSSLEDLKKTALLNYNKASESVNHWDSNIPKAIEFYFDAQQTQVTDKPKADDWISVDERLPKEGELVTVYRESVIPDRYYIDTGSYGFFNKKIWGDRVQDDWKVTHWQPLPPNPKNKES